MAEDAAESAKGILATKAFFIAKYCLLPQGFAKWANAWSLYDRLNTRKASFCTSAVVVAAVCSCLMIAGRASSQ